MTTPPKIRLALTGSVTPTGLGQISLTRGDEADLQLCLKNADGTLVDISTLVDLTLEIYENSTAATQVSTPITLPSSSFNTTLTLSQWNLGTHQHATFNLTTAQTNIPTETRQLTVWAVIYGTLSDGGRRTFGAGTLTILSGNAGGDPPLEALPPLYPTLSQFAALYPPSVATLTTARTIALTGDVTYTSPPFNGSANVTAAATLATVNSTPGSFGGTTAIPVLTIDGKGRITAATTAAIASSGPTVQILGDSDAVIASGTTVARLATTLTAARTYTLPSPAGYASGSTLTFVDATGSLLTYPATLYAGSAATINGVSSIVLNTPYAAPVLISNGSNAWSLDIRGVTRGGTGATNPAAARTNLGAYGSGDSPAFTSVTLGTSGNLFGGTNLIEQRNGASNPQAYRVYNVFSGTGADEWFEIDWKTVSGKVRVGTNKSGGGLARELNLISAGNIRLFSTGGQSVIVRDSSDLNNIFEVSQISVIVSKPFIGNGASATISAYGLNTSTTVYERLISRYNSGSTRYEIFTEKGSSGGAARPLALGTDGTPYLTIDVLGRIIPVLPTSASGLPLGALWNDAGTVKVVIT